MSRMFFFGFGYVASHLAPLLKEAGWELAGTTRDQTKVNAMWEAGVEPHIWEGEHPIEKPGRMLQGSTHILHSIPPGNRGDHLMRHHRKLLAAIGNKISWFGYLSTTGVYGRNPEGWVDEGYEINPETMNGEVRARIEKNFLGMHKNAKLPTHIFRLGAIYGPGRGIFTRVQRGQEVIMRKEDHMVSRVHVDDIARTLFASASNPNPGSIYNVVDDFPSNSEDPAKLACELLNKEPLPIVEYTERESYLSEPMKNHFMTNRRISNKKIKEELSVELMYPSYKEGFRAIAEQDASAQST